MTTPVNHALYNRRAGKIVPPDPDGAPPAAGAVLAPPVRSLEPLGWTFSPELVEACLPLSEPPPS